MYTQQQNRVVTHLELTRVQKLIEKCLQLYLTRNEAIDVLNRKASVEPAFTEIVWEKLEQENKDFFKAYNFRLIVKDQITQFNSLLETQWKLMCQTGAAELAPVPRSNGSHVSPLHHDSGSYAQFQPESLGMNGIPSTFFTAGVSQNTQYNQTPNLGMEQGMNGLAIGFGNGHAGNTYMPMNMMSPLQGPMSSSQQILPNLDLADFSADFGNNFGDKSNFDMFDRFDQENFGSD